ncbi:Calpain-12 [Forsythia ovata]|uniref:Calpain-12 n=1 Tax=Forsythia ovata TaxID=205694 RepID=A0ABD1UU50_9LAMI
MACLLELDNQEDQQLRIGQSKRQVRPLASLIGYDGYLTGLPLNVGNGLCEQGIEVWLGVRTPTDVDAFGRSDSKGAESKMHIMDVFLWGRCLNEDEIASLAAAIGPRRNGTSRWGWE